MRLHNLFTLLALPLVTLAVKPAASRDKFQKFHTKSLSSAPLVLDDDVFNSLTSQPRDYSVAILLTALGPQYQCQLCREFQPEWDLLGRSWIKGDKSGESRVIFGTLDFDRGKGAFQKLSLTSAPVLLLYQPTTGPHASKQPQPIRYDFTSGQQSADITRNWITRNLPHGPHPAVQRPFNWVKFMTIGTIVLSTITLFSLTYEYLVPVLQNRNVWAAISLISILLFTAGEMFNHIRKTPYVGNGGREYFAGGFGNQYGLETQIIAAIYGVLSFATIALALKVPRIKDERMQQVWCWVWAAVMLGMYSFLLSIFRVKNGGYPFWLPPF